VLRVFVEERLSRRYPLLFLISCICLAFSSGVAAQGIWTFTDDNGVVHLGNTAPPVESKVRWLSFDERVRGLSGAVVVRGPAYEEGYRSFRPLLESVAREHAIDPALVIAVAAAESGFRADAISQKGAVGLMQVMPATAARYGVSSDTPRQAVTLLKNPEVNTQVGVRYLADLLRLFEGELELAIAAYNAGEGAVLRHGKRIPPYPETQRYVGRVLRLYRTLSGGTR